MGGHQIGHQILLFSDPSGFGIEFALKLPVQFDVRLPHAIQNMGRTMLRRHTQLPADMVLHQLFQERIAGILQHVVVPDPGADEYLFHTGKSPEGAKHMQIFTVIGLQSRACGGSQTFFPLAQPRFKLFFTGGLSEICRRSTHIVNVSLKTGAVCQLFCLA